jgi:hypothetical protein
MAKSGMSRSVTPPKTTSSTPEKSGQHDDAVREDEPPPAQRERVGEKLVEGEHAAEAREVGEARVRREGEHGDDRAHGHVIEDAPPRDGARQLREHALVARLPGLGGADAVRARQERDAGEERHEDRDDRVSVRSALRMWALRKIGTPLLTASTPVIAVQPLAKARMSSHRLAAPPGRGARAGMRRRRVPAGERRLHAADRDDREERRDEQVRRQEEREPRLARAAQVDDREEHEDDEAQRERVAAGATGPPRRARRRPPRCRPPR